MLYRRGTRPSNPLLVDRDQSGTVDRTAKLEHLSEKQGQLRLIGSDGIGGFWYIDGLKKGKHTIRILYKNNKTAQDIGTPEADGRIWSGKATTRELTIEITDNAPASASSP